MKNSLSNQEFKAILFKTKSLKIRDLVFYYEQNMTKPGISFIVNRKKGIAVDRNLFKRRCRALFNKYLIIPNNKNIQIIVRPHKMLNNNYSWKELSLSFEQFFSKLHL